MGGGASTIKALHTCRGADFLFERLARCVLALLYCRFTRVHSPLAAATNAICLFGIIVCLVFVKYDHFLLINPLDLEPFLLSLLCSVSAVT